MRCIYSTKHENDTRTLEPVNYGGKIGAYLISKCDGYKLIDCVDEEEHKNIHKKTIR